MNKQAAGTVLAILFIIVAGLRITLAFAHPTLTYDGYDELRKVTHIAETGKPLLYDDLSYGGRQLVYSPLYYYILAPFTLLFDPVLVLKFLPNIFYAFVVLLIYFISQELTRNRTVSLIAATLGGLTPIMFAQYINDANPMTIALPLFLMTVYALLKLKERLPLFIISGVLLGLTSTTIYLLLGGLFIYILILNIEKLALEEATGEAAFFLLFFTLWSSLVLYKAAFLAKGLGAIWQYIPHAVYNNFFSEFTLVGAVTTVGILPLIFGGYAAYHALFERRNRRAILLASIAAAVAITLFFRLIQLRTGMLILTCMLSILAAQGLGILVLYFKKTRVPATRYAIVAIVLLFFIFASALPAVTQAADEANDVPTPATIHALQWARHLTDARILATPKEGFLVAYEAQQKTVIDRNYLLVDEADALFDETEIMYRSRFALPVLEHTQERGITHILFSDVAKKMYARDELLYTDSDCFQLVFSEAETQLYEVICNVKTK